MVPAQNGNTKIFQRACGPNTGDEIIIDKNSTRWLVVSEFSQFRATGERRAILKYGAIFEI